MILALYQGSLTTDEVLGFLCMKSLVWSYRVSFPVGTKGCYVTVANIRWFSPPQSLLMGLRCR